MEVGLQYNMETSIPKIDIINQLFMQLQSFFLLSNEEKNMILSVFEDVLNRCKLSFSGDGKYFGKEPVFNPYHSVKDMIFLYTLSNEIFKVYGRNIISDKVYYLNKIMNGVDLFYEIEMPNHWGAEHPVGSVMGRAKYDEGFFFYQCCTVGGTKDKNGNIYYPTLGKNVHITDGTRFITHDGGTLLFRHIVTDLEITKPITVGNNVYIGNNVILLPGVHVGNNVVIGAGAVVSRDIPDNSVAVGVPARVIKTCDEYFEKIQRESLHLGHLKGQEKDRSLCKHQR